MKRCVRSSLVSRSVLLRMRNVSYKRCRRNNLKSPHFMFPQFFSSLKSCHLWDNAEKMVDPDRQQMVIWRKRFTYWIPEAADTLIIFCTLCFSTAKVVTRTRLSVNWLFCSYHYSWFGLPADGVRITVKVYRSLNMLYGRVRCRLLKASNQSCFSLLRSVSHRVT